MQATRALPMTQGVGMNPITQPLLSLEVLLPLQCGMPECIAHRHRLYSVV